MLNTEKSRHAFAAAKEVIPGGVNSPVRAFGAVGDYPIFAARGEGAYVYDIDGNRYLDYISSWGPLLLGHAHPQIVAAVQETVVNGATFGMPTLLETEMAELICTLVPSIEMVRMVSSGTEATMSALRLARGHTRRNKIVKFAGCYHGHSDQLLIQAGSGALTFGVPSSPGVPEHIAQDTLTAEYNDFSSVEKLFAAYGDDIAAVILEPIAGNMGLVLPDPLFLENLRELTKRTGALLIFDEVISGFRARLGGAQEYYNITPDLTCLGKIIGGGLPVGAYGGKKEIMQLISPAGPVYQAGTLSGNPLALRAGLTTLQILAESKPYAHLDQLSQMLTVGLCKEAEKYQVPIHINRFGSLLTVFFTDQQVNSYQTATSADSGAYKAFFQAMLAQGMYLPPSQFECWFISMAHTEADIAATIQASTKGFAAVAAYLQGEA